MLSYLLKTFVVNVQYFATFSPEGNPEQCQWESHPIFDMESPDDHNLVPESNSLPLSTPAYPVIKDPYCDVVFTTIVVQLITLLCSFIGTRAL